MAPLLRLAMPLSSVWAILARSLSWVRCGRSRRFGGLMSELRSQPMMRPARNNSKAWASNYDKALGTITPSGGGAMGAGIPSPDFSKIDTLKGDFGPIPVLVKADLQLAQNGFLEQYLHAVQPGHAYHLTNIWLYDHPNMLNTAVDQGLTDDQWGMVKERGFPVGPWYLAIPAVFHVYFPGGVTGPGFILWNLLFAAFLLFLDRKSTRLNSSH